MNKVVVAKIVIGDVLLLRGRALEIISITPDYQRNTIACYKTAIVRDDAGVESEINLYANQRYNRKEG